MKDYSPATPGVKDDDQAICPQWKDTYDYGRRVLAENIQPESDQAPGSTAVSGKYRARGIIRCKRYQEEAITSPAWGASYRTNEPAFPTVRLQGKKCRLTDEEGPWGDLIWILTWMHQWVN